MVDEFCCVQSAWRDRRYATLLDIIVTVRMLTTVTSWLWIDIHRHIGVVGICVSACLPS